MQRDQENQEGNKNRTSQVLGLSNFPLKHGTAVQGQHRGGREDSPLGLGARHQPPGGPRVHFLGWTQKVLGLGHRDMGGPPVFEDTPVFFVCLRDTEVGHQKEKTTFFGGSKPKKGTHKNERT